MTMKKKLLMLLSIMVLSSTIGIACAKPVNNAELATSIRLYKSGNYSECYTRLNNMVNRGSSNALAYYYLAMTSAQLGKNSEAISNYKKAMSLSSKGSNVYNYANKGKVCLETPDKCHEIDDTTPIDDLLHRSSGFSEKAKSDYERLKIENLMREMNRSDDMSPQKFKEYRDFSSYNQEGTPSNDEIVAALRTLQRAGFGDIFSNNYSDISLLMGNGNQNNNAMMNLMGNSNLSPQVIQAMLTNNMSLGF